ncbi:MAG: 16S rRNA (guanine(527)-N(7))-methyltransferase RsmG [Pseudanabaenaceae cyanobacterium SKYGB_i_bin29]|nr:16S rRNA (guanine(527)-N(7))-methyltransferase RsmG [Pseudanabaenaceae cyanobacterium SKYG29]MDW8420945.1 16S rRNA (guanine(527)-N(7))-methyltransferase RsmG [Pseudanabaenaceae cyanobacterium SKYGB_i_bin29]
MSLSPEIWQQTLHWQPSEQEIGQFQELYDLVLLGNQTQNLTRITDPVDFWEKHIWDSLRGVKPFWQARHLQVIDIGTGAGFPGLPIAIVFPSWHLTLLDGTLKKIKFVNDTIEKLGLTNAIGVHGRAEELGTNKYYRHQFDLVLIRAVGSVPACLKYGLPLTKPGGTIVLYRGHWHPQEANYLVNQNWQIDSFVTPISQSQRNCVYIKV